MLINDLFQKILVDPVKKEGADKLLIVSGYATPNMADFHMNHLKQKLNSNPSIKLIHGMARSGISTAKHKAFQKIDNSNEKFSCHYLIKDNLCHAKVFIWLRENHPIKAFVGSANYTLTGFSENQTECVAEVSNPNLAKDFFNGILQYCVSCNKHFVEHDIELVHPSKNKKEYNKKDIATLPLVVESTQQVPDKSGLNWGQRKGREHNQAYIPIPQNIRERNFFPPRQEAFTVLTDDGESFVMVVAQDNSKALHSTENNSLIGLYFRKRLGLESGAFVTIEDLKKYGRLDVDFYFIEPETYYMDFSSDTEKETGEEASEK